MTASACFTLAFIHFSIWWQQRGLIAHLLFGLTAVSTALFAGGELTAMKVSTPALLALTVRWTHVPIWFMVLSLTGFVRFYFRAGRDSLAWTVCGLRTISLLLNFVTGTSLNYDHITAVDRLSFLGETVSVARGVANPAMIVGQVSLLLLAVFVVDASIAVWQRGERRKALVIGGSIIFFLLTGAGLAAIKVWAGLRLPFMSSLFSVGIIAAMSLELSRDAFRTTRLTKELRGAENRTILIAEAANLGIWIRDLVLDDIWATARWRDLFGFSNSEPLKFGQFIERLHRDDRQAVRTAVDHAAESDGWYFREYRAVLPDGRTRWIASHGYIEKDDTGRPVRILGVCSDVTPRKVAELETRMHRDRAIHSLRVATLGELSSSLAHELNQPLMAIMSNAQAAQRLVQKTTIDRQEIDDILGDIVSDDRRASEVIIRLRKLLKKGEPHRQSLDANAMVEDVLKLLSADLAAREVTVITELAADLPPIYGDSVQLQQVMINLILNAADAMAVTPPGRRRLTLGSSRPEEKAIEICVCDTGPGIRTAELETIFEPYHTTKPQGLGLGLSLSRSIAVAHNGHLWAKNQDSAGAIFCFRVPVSQGGVT